MDAGSPFSLNIVALAIYLRVTHAISYLRLSRLFLHCSPCRSARAR
jgi:transposase